MSYSSEVLADSPYLYWRLGESSGTSAADASGNSRPGTYVGSPTLAQASLIPTDSGDTCVDFDGFDDYVQSGVVLNTAVATINVWYNYSGTPPGGTSFIAGFLEAIGSNTVDKVLLIDSSGHVSAYAYDGSQVFATDSNALSSGVHMLTLRCDGSTIKLYIDGAEVASTACGNTYAGYGGSGNIFVSGVSAVHALLGGKRDEFAVWNSAVDPSRIAAWYDAGVNVGTQTTDSDTVYLDLQPSSTDLIEAVESATVYLDLVHTGVEEFPFHYLDDETIYLDLRCRGLEDGSFHETFENLDAWDLTDGETDSEEIAAKIEEQKRNLYITRKHAMDGPTSLRMAYDTVYGDFPNSFNNGFFVQWEDVANGGSSTKTYWLAYSFMLEDWSRVWQAGLGGGGNEAFLGVITMPGFLFADYQDYNCPFVLSANDEVSGDLIVQYPYTSSPTPIALSAGVIHTVKISHTMDEGTGDFSTAIYLDGVLIDSLTDNDSFFPIAPRGIAMFQTQSRAAATVYLDDMIYSVDAEPRDPSDVETGDGTTTEQWIKIRDKLGSQPADITVEIDPTFTNAVTDVFLYCKFYVPQVYLDWISFQGSNYTTSAFLQTSSGASFNIRRVSGVNKLNIGGQLGFVTLTAGWHTLAWHEVAGDPNLKIIFDGVEYDYFYGSLHTENPDGTNYVEARSPESGTGLAYYEHGTIWLGIQELAASLTDWVRSDRYDFRFPMQSYERDYIMYPNSGTPDPASYPPYYGEDGDFDNVTTLEEGFPFQAPGLQEPDLDDSATVYLDLDVESLDIFSVTQDADEVYLQLRITYAQAYGSTDLAIVNLDLTALGGECHSTWSSDFLGEGDAYVGLVGNAQAAIVGEAEADFTPGEVFLGATVNC